MIELRWQLHEVTNMNVTKESLLSFFESELAIDVGDIEDDTEIVSTGVIDSFSLVTLITFLEKEASIRIEPLDVNLNNLDTINRILTFVKAKTEEA